MKISFKKKKNIEFKLKNCYHMSEYKNDTN